MHDTVFDTVMFFGTPGGLVAVAFAVWVWDLFFNDDDPGGPGWGL